MKNGTGLMWLDNTVLESDPWDQSLNPERVKQIVDQFSPELVNPIKVAFLDGKYIILDGKHTRAALRKIKGSESFPILCKVYSGLTYEEEAELFCQLCGGKKSH